MKPVRSVFKLVITLIIAFSFSENIYAQNWDIDLLKKINPSDPSSTYWKVTSSSAYWLPATGIVSTFVVGLAKDDKQLKIQSYQALISIAVNTAASEILKFSINRERPAYAYPNDITEATPKSGTGHSFPSGHTAMAFNYATTLTLEYKKWYVAVPSYLWAGSVGYSRLYLGKHYPSDVFAGAVLGTATGWLSYKLNKKLFKKK